MARAMKLACVLTFLLGLGVAQTLQTACPDGWLMIGNKCFFFSEEEGSWSDAMQSCTKMEATLAEISTATEISVSIRYGRGNAYWVGIQRNTTNATLHYADGRPANLPSPVGGNEQYVYLTQNGLSTARVYADRKWICTRIPPVPPCDSQEERCELCYVGFALWLMATISMLVLGLVVYQDLKKAKLKIPRSTPNTKDPEAPPTQQALIPEEQAERDSLGGYFVPNV